LFRRVEVYCTRLGGKGKAAQPMDETEEAEAAE
jgi:hypothetical protein